VIRLSASAGSLEITGLDSSSARDGEWKMLVNVGTVAITLPHNDPGSIAANRFTWPLFGLDLSLSGAAFSGFLGDCVIIRYDKTLGCWGTGTMGTPMPHGPSHVTGTDDVPIALGATGAVGGRKGILPAPDAGMQTYVPYGRSPGGSLNDIEWDVSGMVDLSPNLSFDIPTGNAMYFPDRCDIGAAIDAEIGADAVLEIG